MSEISCPAVLVSAAASGQGKTLATAALARTWRKRGLRVQAFKCGPDFIDSMILQAATGRPVYNLDLGMCGLADGQAQLYHAAQNSDVLIIEGVMGLYDGTPSTADIALAFALPVALVIDASAMAQTFAAVAHGLYSFNPRLQRAGVLANKVGSAGHASLLKNALAADTPWLGTLPQDAQFSLPERHLGLHLAQEIHDLEARIEAAALALSAHGEIALPPNVTFSEPVASQTYTPLLGKTIAIARDAAFCFIYPANIDCLQNLGAKLVYFSPLADAHLPEADAYWLPGGYPELHLAQLSQNRAMRNSLQQTANAGKAILAECGGMMALGQTLNGVAMFGLLPGNSEIQSRLQGLGTQHLTIDADSIAAHTFHYGQFSTDLPVACRASSQYGQGEALYQQANIRASFLHFYFASNPQLSAQFFST